MDHLTYFARDSSSCNTITKVHNHVYGIVGSVEMTNKAHAEILTRICACKFAMDRHAIGSAAQIRAKIVSIGHHQIPEDVNIYGETHAAHG
jgi:hypothetical protein